MKIYNHVKSATRVVLFLAFGTTILVSCKKDTDMKPTIAQVAVTLQGFSQLEAATIKSGLAVTLSNKNTNAGSGGNFTAFAPTNQAFAALGLVNPEDFNGLQSPFLSNLLKYHLSDGASLEDDLANTGSVTSLLGPGKRIIIRNNSLYVNGSKVLASNVRAENGILHAIDRVLLATTSNIAATVNSFAQGNAFVKPELSFLAEAILYTDLTSTLASSNIDYTFFAPTNQAFKDYGRSQGLTIESPADVRKLPKNALTQILMNHVFNLAGQGKFTSELYEGNIISVSSQSVSLGAYDKGLLTVKGKGNAVVANMVIPDIQTSNGVIHIIDRVLLP